MTRPKTLAQIIAHKRTTKERAQEILDRVEELPNGDRKRVGDLTADEVEALAAHHKALAGEQRRQADELLRQWRAIKETQTRKGQQ
jgi:hypothetical protein